MALGDRYQSNNNNNKNYSPTVYSGYKFSNPESKVDPTTLGFSYWNNMLKITLAPRKEGQEIAYDYEKGITLYLTHTKARLLLQEIEEFQKNPETYKNVGVPSGAGLISLTNGSEFGVSGLFLVLRKINPESGEVEASMAYELKTDYHFSIRNYKEGSSDFDTVYYNNIELDQIKTLLKSYYEAMTGAIAYSIIENNKYDHSRMNTKMGLIMDKLGIESKTNYSNKSSNSYFNNNGGNHSKENTSFQSSSYEDALGDID